MKRHLKSGRGAAAGLLLALAAPALAQEGEPPVEEGGAAENDYGGQGQLEVGGSLSGSWTSSLFTLGLSPSVGYFLLPSVELSLIGELAYESAEGAEAVWTGSVLLEPSYHQAISDRLSLLGGLGVGVARGGGRTAFDLAPRIGLNIDVGRSGVLTPSVSVPILFGRAEPEDALVTGGLTFALGISTTF